MTKKIINKQDLLFPARAGGNLRLLTPLRNILHYTSSTREASNASLCFPGAAPPPLHIPSIANSTVLLPNLPAGMKERIKGRTVQGQDMVSKANPLRLALTLLASLPFI